MNDNTNPNVLLDKQISEVHSSLISLHDLIDTRATRPEHVQAARLALASMVTHLRSALKPR